MTKSFIFNIIWLISNIIDKIQSMKYDILRYISRTTLYNIELNIIDELTYSILFHFF